MSTSTKTPIDLTFPRTNMVAIDDVSDSDLEREDMYMHFTALQDTQAWARNKAYVDSLSEDEFIHVLEDSVNNIAGALDRMNAKLDDYLATPLKCTQDV